MSTISNSSEMSAGYLPQDIESRWYSTWKGMGIFHAEPQPGKPHYSITIPPPNITGSLHMGHALNNSILDSLTRWHRMRGFVTLCLPGTDHAGIATQNVVERDLAAEGLSRTGIGREAFIERCKKWRETYGTRIYHQFERLGCSYDWDRVRYTMDQSYVDAIMEAFGSWYQRGFIYRGTRVVNWDVKFQSAISDIEVLTEERQGKLYHFRYPFEDESGFITIATTRPETLLGDSAVAANPDDERYQALFGKMLKLPLTNRTIPLIADSYAKPEFGSGAVKVTPAHDLNDFECGLRHGLAQRVVIGKDGSMTEEAGPDFVGLDRNDARKKVVELMDGLGLLEKIEDYTIQTPISDRSGEVVEPLLSEQWFMNMNALAEPAIDAVKSGLIHFIPQRYESTYLQWMDNIRDWCISRQLWWGHRIPIWWTDEPSNGNEVSAEGYEVRSFGAKRYVFARAHEEAARLLGTTSCSQDEDVLDTWFSSALWPQATLGWPANTQDLANFYPTNLLSTAQEILYLWVSRMVMSGMDFVERPLGSSPESDGLVANNGISRKIIPFHDVYIHATVLDAKGERMSKSKGNGIDPIDIIEKYGADATRFSLLQQAGKNQDIKYSEKRPEVAASFCNKLWNGSRFVLLNLEGMSTGEFPPKSRRTSPDNWILDRLQFTVASVNANLSSYDMDDAARAMYEFFWNDYCDWYVEIAKVKLRSGDPQVKADTQAILCYVLENTLRLLHPMIPFITEEIWQHLPYRADGESISLAAYPVEDRDLLDPDEVAAMDLTFEAIRSIRNLKAELGIPPGKRINGAGVATSERLKMILTKNQNIITELARLSEFLILPAAPSDGKWVSSAIRGGEILLDVGESLNVEKELERITKELAEVDKQIVRSRSMLDNPNFVERAAPTAVEKERTNLQQWLEKQQILVAKQNQLQA